MNASIVENFLLKKENREMENWEDIGNHSICPKMCLTTYLISFLGELLSAFNKSYNAFSLKVTHFTMQYIESVYDELDAI